MISEEFHVKVDIFEKKILKVNICNKYNLFRFVRLLNLFINSAFEVPKTTRVGIGSRASGMFRINFKIFTHVASVTSIFHLYKQSA